ncbi:MAG: FAD-binding oxidoreductase [Thermomicrobiales bacterium]
MFGLATPGGQISTTGVAGFTLGGGMGNLRRRWGLACDNLISAEVVTADGEVLVTNENEHPDLFWAIRGGGGNFGVVTSFEFQLHDLGPEIYGAVSIFPMDEATEVIRNWRDYIVDAPDEVTCDLFIWGMPPLPDVPEEQHWAPVIIAAGMYAGPVDQVDGAFDPVKEFGTVIADLSGPRPYVEFQSDFDPLFPDGLQYYWKSLFASDLDDEAIEGIASLAVNRPTPQTLLALRSLGGVMARVSEDATAYGNRDASFNLSIDATWRDPDDSERVIGWTRDSWACMRDLTGGGVYLNFAGLGEENDELIRAGYGDNLQRLKDVKRRYDPTNLFRGNINITPGS